MKKMLALVIMTCACIFVVALLSSCACTSSEVSRSSEKDFVSSTQAEEKKDTVSTDPVYILAVGNDSRYQTSEDTGVDPDGVSYGDTIMVLRVDPATNNIAILTIPRDTAADVAGQPDKVNALHAAGGIDALKTGVGEMLGVEIPYYLDLKFVDFAALVDNLGGITVNVPMSLSGGDIISGETISLEAGENTLDGASALMLARQRKIYSSNGEAVRQMISREMVASAIQFVANHPASEANTYVNLIETIGQTNMTHEVLEAYISAFMNNESPIEFNLGTAPYEGDIDETGGWRIAFDSAVYAELHAAMENNTPLTNIISNPVAAY